MQEFVPLAIDNLEKLTTHSYIARQQSSYLRKLKENIAPNTAILLLDFAENFAFTVQDEIQSYHWNTSQATLHPVCMYYYVNASLQCHSYCIISDDMNHDVSMVYQIQKKCIQPVQEKVESLTKIMYFSDGCAAQYKNRKNFLNLCNHSDFSVAAEWIFFATSHGKSPCDSIGGTIKRTVTKASLQRPYNDQILTPAQLFEFCKENINGIDFIFISKEIMEQVRNIMNKRFQIADKPIPGTRNFHHFIPLGDNKIGIKRVSWQDHFDLVFNFGKQHIIIRPTPHNYVACLYDKNWWIGMVMSVNDEEHDAEVKFMHPHGPARSFFWPSREDLCYVPYNHILLSIGMPSTSSGRQYRISDKDFSKIQSVFSDINN